MFIHMRPLIRFNYEMCTFRDDASRLKIDDEFVPTMKEIYINPLYR